MKAPLVLVGAITGASGLKGEVRLASFTEDPEAIAEYGPLLTEDGRSFVIESLRRQTNGFVARVKGITTREAAEALRGIGLHIRRDALPKTEDDEYYLSDLIGLSVSLTTGETLGTVIAVENFGASDLLDVQLANERRSVYVPFTSVYVPEVDIEARRIVIDPPDGLLDDPSKLKPDPEQP